MPDLLFLDAITDAALLGGKAAGLARLTAAGLPVPPGFVLTTDAYRRLHAAGIRSDPAFAQSVLDAYRRLGGGPVAVRSSAVGEDSADSSFAGQLETRLGVAGGEPLLDAIEHCWKSLHAARAVAYRRERGISDDLAMAVVVQQLVPAEVAGVLFTRDPTDPTGRLMAVEASRGLGEAVVSGRVTPDRSRLDRDTGAVVERHPGRQGEPCLSDNQLSQLAELGRRVESLCGEPSDVEWAFAGGAFHLLQARPITAGSAAEREQVRAEVIEHLRATADPAGTVWARYSLGEALPAPTPMTWAVVQRLVAADGGFGAMNRDLGARPDPALGSRGAFDLVAGRPMANLSRLPRMQYVRPPIEYPFAVMKADPRRALDPKPTLNPARVGWRRLPGVIWRLHRMATATRRQAETFAATFTTAIAQRFAAEARAALARDWKALDPPALRAAFDTWVQRTLVDFARDSLKPTVLADLAWTTLFEQLKRKLGEERARAAVGEMARGARPPAEADLVAAVTALAAGEMDRPTFLDRFGHRCGNEMELAQPRWSEVPNEIRAPDQARGRPSPGLKELDERIAALTPALEAPTDTWAGRLRTYLGLREFARHHLMLGYAVIRRALVELDARFGLRGGIFYLLPTELDDLLAGADLSARIAERRKRRQLELSLEVPPVLFSDDLDAIGRPVPSPEGATTFAGVGLSAGVAEAPALVLAEPTGEVPAGPFVLVCPSADPAWVPLFARAVALVMETGGVLSHGAIVAREFGRPAVAGLPGVVRQIRTGDVVRVDGTTGTVAVVVTA
ncbi:MAG TPA: PEP/pyruvate-binding domain-containing protein [Fimbriiglobus sp.]|nr:PEP/pyruvate-binding domain-containing protein [Fimbriiglobus sp.]